MNLSPSFRQPKNRSALHIYGPVPSRRLGFSLGVDVIPYKTCSFDCIYCQLGRTGRKRVRREEFFSPQEILDQVKAALASGRRVDYITFSGSGEPTLTASLGKLIRRIKKMTPAPVVVLTNSSFFSRRGVRKELLAADIVMPSLDAASQDVFARVNRPHPRVKVKGIIEGLAAFRKEFKGQIWLEIMLVKGVNDSPAHFRALKKAVAMIQPDRIQLNTVVRPPAEKWARPLSRWELEVIRKKLGDKAEVIAEFKKRRRVSPAVPLEEDILALIKRRPVTLRDISLSLGRNENEVVKRLQVLLQENKIKRAEHNGLVYYEPISSNRKK